ncbi:glutamate-rich protein 2 isoform A [Alligator mississippiensis]|uniref:Glutamate-rich protein 2 isoform A n=3 Tax=Alligator mississippiensis TaxID=8496 RepID=A0A151M018_ALLMI|nr:glutamate-rich protein 2 isoform A [Alligator mississippiensis]
MSRRRPTQLPPIRGRAPPAADCARLAPGFDAAWGRGPPSAAAAAAPQVSGMLEVIGPEDGFILQSFTESRANCIERTDGMKEQKKRKNGRLHVFGPKEEVVIEPIQTAPGMGYGAESASKMYSPTKQISLCAAKSSIEKWDASGKSVKNKHSSRNPETYLKPLCSMQKNTDSHTDQQLKMDLHRLSEETKISEARRDNIKSEASDEKEKNSRSVEKTANSIELQPNSVDNHNFDELSQTTDDDESSSEHSENENGKGSAPIELLGEFLKAIMGGNYSLAKKLCHMILIYEPENTEAKQFLPLLEEKLLMEGAQNSTDTESEETDEGSSDDSEEDTTSSSSSSEDESEESSDDSDENI